MTYKLAISHKILLFEVLFIASFDKNPIILYHYQNCKRNI